MKPLLILLLPLSLAGHCADISISLVPEDELGSRQPEHLQFTAIKWNTDSPWFHKPAPVCKVVERPLDLSLVKQEAERRGMITEKLEPGSSLGTKEEGAFSYASAQPPWVAAGGSPRRRYIFFATADFHGFERDKYQMAMVKPLATREQSLAICREWMKRLGIDESQFSRQGDWPEGFEVNVTNGQESGTHPVTKEEVSAVFGQQLRFVQQIGGLPAFWSGFGGNIMFDIADGGEFCGLNGCLRAWEKIGDYEVLDRAGIEAAVKGGFAWVHDPINCEKMEVVKVELEAYHSNWKVPQKDFPLIYSLHCKLHGGTDNGLEKVISLPALKQHRDKYGPPPEEFKKPALPGIPQPTAKPFEEMTPEELEEFKRKWVESGGTIIPPGKENPAPAERKN